MIETMREIILFRKSALFVEVLTILQKNVKNIRKYKKKHVRLVIQTKNELNVHLANDLDADL